MATFPAMGEPIRNFLRPWREKKGLTLEALGEKIGANKTTLSRIEAGKRGLTLKWIQRYAAGLSVSPEELLSQPPENVEKLPQPDAVAAVDAPPLNVQQYPLDIEVKGTAVGGDDGDFHLNGNTIDYVRRGPGIIGRRGVFAIYCTGSSMEPWRRKGELVYLDSVRPARPGDHVVVECHGHDHEPGPAFLKLLVAETPTKLRLKQYSPLDDRIEIPKARVRRVYRVLEWTEVMGI